VIAPKIAPTPALNSFPAPPTRPRTPIAVTVSSPSPCRPRIPAYEPGREPRPSRHEKFLYDGLNRLVKARGIASRSSFAPDLNPGQTDQKKFEFSYVYALNGNLTEKIASDYDSHTESDHWQYTYTNHKARFIATSAQAGTRFTMSYDAAGNTISKADAALNLTKLMSYDSQNRIQSITNAATSEVMGEYRYDDQGFRVYKKHKQTTNTVTTTYELETPNKYFAVERQKDLANNPVPNTEYAVNNVFLDGVRIAAVIPSGAARWFMTDQVDSVNVVTNDAGDAISAIDYLPYGETWYQTGDTGFSPKYNSQELDKESGLYFFNARHYDPEIARFETADSVVDGESSIVGWNRYAYVKGNPIMYKDPTGHFGQVGGAGYYIPPIPVVAKTQSKTPAKAASTGNASDKAQVEDVLRFQGTEKKVFQIKGKNGKVTDVFNRSSDIEILNGENMPNNTDFWGSQDWSKKTHGGRPKNGGSDQIHRVDLPSATDIPGPNHRFRVPRANQIIGKPGDRFGTKVDLDVLNEKDEVIGSVRIAHPTKVNSRILNAKPDEIFEPGTYIGTSHRPVGNTTGAHTHIEAIDSRGVEDDKKHRNDLLHMLQ
jgi:RHS repeat-associated protein